MKHNLLNLLKENQVNIEITEASQNSVNLTVPNNAKGVYSVIGGMMQHVDKNKKGHTGGGFEMYPLKDNSTMMVLFTDKLTQIYLGPTKQPY